MKTINEIVAGILNGQITVRILNCGRGNVTGLVMSQEFLFICRFRRWATIFEIMSRIMYRSIADQGIVVDTCGRSVCGCSCWCWRVRGICIRMCLICQIETSPCLSFYNRILNCAIKCPVFVIESQVIFRGKFSRFNYSLEALISNLNGCLVFRTNW